MVSCAPFDVGLCASHAFSPFQANRSKQSEKPDEKRFRLWHHSATRPLHRLIEKETLKDFVIKRCINVSAINPQNEILKSLRVFMKSQKAVLLINDDCWWKSLQSFRTQHREKINFSHLSKNFIRKEKERFKMKAQHVAALN